MYEPVPCTKQSILNSELANIASIMTVLISGNTFFDCSIEQIFLYDTSNDLQRWNFIKSVQ